MDTRLFKYNRFNSKGVVLQRPYLDLNKKINVSLVSTNQNNDKTNPKSMTALEFKNEVLPYKTKLFRFALSYLKSIDDAKDVVQDVMIKAWEFLSNNKGEIRKIEAWCMTAVKNRCLDFLKRSGKNTIEIESQFDLVVEEQSPLEILDVKNALERVKDIMGLLPQRQQDVLKLRDIEGNSYKEISEKLNINISLVKVDIFRARNFIKDKMNKLNAYGI